MFASQIRTARHLHSRFVPRITFRGLIDALIEADRQYREARKLERIGYPHLKDMGIDLGRVRDRAPRG